MMVELAREGATAKARPEDLASWRDWAYQAAQASGETAEGGVAIEAQATGRDVRSLVSVISCFKALEQVIAGLVAGGMLSSNHKQVVEVTVRRPRVTGVDGLVVRISDFHAPF